MKKATSLGVAPTSLKLPVISSMSFSTSRSKDWDDVVTTSESESLGRTWSVEGKRVGKWTLSGEGSMQVSFQNKSSLYSKPMFFLIIIYLTSTSFRLLAFRHVVILD